MRIVSCKFGYILAAVSVMAVLPVLDAHGAVVTFNDAQLEQAVRQEIDKLTGPIYDTDLRGRVQLLAEYRDITDLSGLEYMVDLETLQLNNNLITDLTPLAGLVKLKKLYLNSNYISDISPLQNMVKLEQLILHTNFITDIEPLVLNTGINEGDVVRLDSNFIDDNSLCNYIPVLQARNVNITYYGECGAEEVVFPDPQLEEVVRDSFRLQTGRLLGDPISVSELQEAALVEDGGQPLFRELYGDHMGIKDLTGLQYCVNLQKVFLAGNEIKTISQLTSLTSLKEAHLGGNQITSLKPLAALYSLQRLEVPNNKISNLAPIRYLTNITQLALHGNSISDLTPLQNFYSLLLLTVGNQHDVDGKPILSNIATVAGFKSLIDLDVSGNKIQDLSPITNLTNLQLLNISNLHDFDTEGSKVLLLKDLNAVSKLTKLSILDASNGLISDLGPLAPLGDLTCIYLQNNKITNLFVMAGLAAISRLDVRDNQISSVSPLVANMGIGETDPGSELGLLDQDYVDVRGNSLSQESLCNDIPTLQKRRAIVEYDGFCCDESQRFLLTTQVNGEGSVDPLGTRQFCSGTTITLAAKPAAGWRFAQWQGDLTSTENPIEISIISNMRVTAVFVSETERFDLQVFTSGEGAVTLDPVQPAQGYSSGTPVKATAVPASGWVFDHWEGAAIGSATETTVTMDADKVLRAFFKKLGPIYTLTTAVKGEGSVNPVTGKEHKYPENTLVPVTARPAIGWVFDHWEGGLVGNVNPTVLTMNSNKAVTAVFKRDNFDYTLAIVCEGDGATTPAAGYHRYNSGDEETIVAVPSDGWVFDRWTGDVAGVEPTATVKMESDKTIKAVFVMSETYTLTMAVQGGGSVTPSAGAHVIAQDKKVTLIATADNGWIFDRWTQDIGGNQNPLLVQINKDISATAVFRPYPYIASLNPVTGYTTGNQTITINGLNLDTATRVLFGQTPGVIQSATATQIQVRTPSHERGSVDIVVETALGVTPPKMAAFTFVETPEPPQIDSVSPQQGPVIGLVPVIIRGVNVGQATSVTFGGKEVEEIVNSDTNRLLVVPPLLSEIPETLPYTVDVVVTTPFGSDTCAACYSYVMTPQIASVYPSQAYIDGGDTIYLAGLGFDGAYSVKFDGIDATIVSVEENLIQVTAPAHAAGTVDITVTTGVGTGTLEQGFNYFAEAATIVCTVYNTTSKKPVLDATVRIDPQTKTITNSTTGTYTFQHVRPGTYQVTVITSYCLPVSQQITVQQNERGVVDAQLQCLPDSPLPCGVNVGKLASGIAEESIPMSLEQDPDGFVEPNTPIAIRVGAAQGIDPATVWATAESQTWVGDAASWQETVAGDATDGWIVMTPGTPMPVGEIVTVTVGANTTGGEAIDPVTLTFAVGPEGMAKSLVIEPQLLPAATAGMLVLPEMIALEGSEPLRLSPPALYTCPVPVRLPIPGDSAKAGLYYYSEAVAHQGWYPAEKVQGLLAEDVRIVEEDGQAYLETSVNHAGIFQVGKQINVPGQAAAMDVELRGSRNQWLALASVLLALSITLGIAARPRKNH